mmetsp:Transcript_3116/g.9483  ORF Transcript_3116/g.9483 Transcript_3116/m.9483 type:complete len:220 (+) Transcript_3116:1124-1783(+)
MRTGARSASAFATSAAAATRTRAMLFEEISSCATVRLVTESGASELAASTGRESARNGRPPTHEWRVPKIEFYSVGSTFDRRLGAERAMSFSNKQRELQGKMEEMVQTLDARTIMPKRKSAFLEMAKCCDLSDPQAYQQCVARAQQPEQRASQAVQQEMGEFQNRLQRAIQNCQDEVKDGGYRDQNRAQNVFSACVEKVFDKHIGMVGDVKKRLEKALK